MSTRRSVGALVPQARPGDTAAAATAAAVLKVIL
jgi:hypothetical protein